MNLRIRFFVVSILAFSIISACTNTEKPNIKRPLDVWAFRSVLDKKPRMLTVALDSQMHVAYDLAQCTLYKVWKGGVRMEGAPYTSKKNIQPTSWGTAYISADHQQNWIVQRDGQKETSKVISKGYAFYDNQLYLENALILTTGDTILIKERPEFIKDSVGRPGLERWFKTFSVPNGVSVSLENNETSFKLVSNDVSIKTEFFDALPEQFPPDQKSSYDHIGKFWMEKSDCFTCHQVDKKDIGPSLSQIAQRYPTNKKSLLQLSQKVREGGSGVWGQNVMNPHPQLEENELKTMLTYILGLKGENESKEEEPFVRDFSVPSDNNKVTPGNGAPLEGVHPSFDLTTLHEGDFNPKVGGLAFLPDGRLIFTTWDTEGGVYILDGFQNGDTSKIITKRIAAGLHEPLGIEVVDGNIFVLQKQELTQLIDHDGDDIIDEYKAICNTWQVTDDFHEFAFGLVYDNGYFYVTLSMAMRLLATEKQKIDRGKTLKIGLDGSYESLNYGLRTPNGIGKGIDGELFVTDNQGQWLPANKLIHVKKDEYHGMAWGILDSLQEFPKMVSPTLWLPQNEISNSPSEPILINEGPYKGQMLHGDVSHGGIKRDFLEKVNGRYQGAVFRFSQGLAAGVNRLCWGPDGALYIGEIGMVGGWTWKETKYGLQRIKFNGKPTFEMLAIRSKPKVFEIEFTQPIANIDDIELSDFFITQWWYKATADYGGPKMDLERLLINEMKLSEDRTKLSVELSGLKKEHIVYFRIPSQLRNANGQQLWSTEAWYTLNNIAN
ncbi:c-type cytochrome [Aurantibacter crassamenti]|uniref:c-type cytochrome n=1 Tax=Aurantibacter crassamenti TaxID=1837375 RepID=UPI00193A3C1F|nr:c-type cytochrome [Aurantibacter crassamenti]MBM1107349.1 c-type cytochrome [Aurantibacter crassamenti]